MNTMARDSIGAMALEGLKRGMSYGQYVAARYYPVRICQVQADGNTILRSAAVPEVLPDWEETVARHRRRSVAGQVRRSRAKKPTLLYEVCDKLRSRSGYSENYIEVERI